jgi:hypothetical protein
MRGHQSTPLSRNAVHGSCGQGLFGLSDCPDHVRFYWVWGSWINPRAHFNIDAIASPGWLSAIFTASLKSVATIKLNAIMDPSLIAIDPSPNRRLSSPSKCRYGFDDEMLAVILSTSADESHFHSLLSCQP